MTMSTDPLQFTDLLGTLPEAADFGVIGRAEAPVSDDTQPQRPPLLATDCRELASMVDTVAAEISAAGVCGHDEIAAVERIQDVAFALRERAVEPALCDALEAANRELTGALARSEAAAERAQVALVELRRLADRINTVAAAGTQARAGASGAPAHVSNDMPLATVNHDPSEPALHEWTVPEEIVLDTRAHATERPPIESLFVITPPVGPAIHEWTVPAEIAHAPGPERDLSTTVTIESAGASTESAKESAEESGADVLFESAPLPDSQALAGPEEDPADLFEPQAAPPAAATSAARVAPHPAAVDPRDPLAAVRALSNEELIALFS
jgi:hypothetical protein